MGLLEVPYKLRQFLSLTAAYIISLIYNLNKCSIMIVSIRASLKTRLIKEKTDRYDSCKETFRRRAVALQGRLTKQMSCIAVFSQKGFLEMPIIYISCIVSYKAFSISWRPLYSIVDIILVVLYLISI